MIWRCRSRYPGHGRPCPAASAMGPGPVSLLFVRSTRAHGARSARNSWRESRSFDFHWHWQRCQCVIQVRPLRSADGIMVPGTKNTELQGTEVTAVALVLGYTVP
eukprot:3186384-Rhodomonas_salina.2